MINPPLCKVLYFLLTISMTVTSAFAAVDLKITEVWPGGFEGAEATSDWFEVTNFGDTAATGIAGQIYYDDRSNDPLLSDPLMGIDTIAPGESVVFITSWEDDFNAVVDDAIAAFVDAWGPLPDVQIGYVPFGSGFGGMEAAVLFDGNSAEANRIAMVEFESVGSVASFVSEADGTWVPRLAQVGVLGAFAGNVPAHDLTTDPPIGSPGTTVPEPAGLVIAGLAFASLLGRRAVRGRV